MGLAERLWAKVEVRGPTECWPWTSTNRSRGYGQINVNGQPMNAHRAAWIVIYGDLAPGLYIDHICHNQDNSCAGGDNCIHRLCCNPSHLEAITSEENKRRGKSRNAENARKTQCKHGHEFTIENTRIRPNGNRSCRTCDRAAAARSNAARKKN